MKTLLVLSADNRIVAGKLFLTMQYANGMMTAEKAIEGVFPEEYDRIIYAITEETEQRFEVREKLFAKMENKYPLEVVCLQENTSGPAETAYRAIKQANVTGELAIRDSHNYIRLSERSEGNFIAGLDLCQYEYTIDNLRSKSFIRINEQRKVLDIVEKRFCSDIISCGLYGFANTSDFIEAYEELYSSKDLIGKLYVSHMITYLIGRANKVFHLADTASFEDWSTPKSWMRVESWHATCFVNYDDVCSGHVPVEEHVLDELRHVSGRGGRIVLFTAADGVDTDEIVQYFAKEKIFVLAVVDRCSFSSIRKIIDNKTQLDFLAMEGI